MGLLDDAIREHLELKRRHGADPEEVSRQEREALGAPAAREFAQPAGDEAAAPGPEAPPQSEVDEELREPLPPPEAEEPAAVAVPPDEEEPPREDVLEETPDFLQETPEHDRLWFEQRPPRDFDWDK
jgi:hypothetical protein